MNTKHRKLVEAMGLKVYSDRAYFHHKLADSHFHPMNHQAVEQLEDGSWSALGRPALEGLDGGLDAPDDIPCGGVASPLSGRLFAPPHQIVFERGCSLEDVRRMNAAVDELIDEILAEAGPGATLVRYGP